MRRVARGIGIAGALAYGPMILLNGACIAGFGPWAIPGSELFILLPLVASVVALVAVPTVFFSRTRRSGLQVIAVSVGLVVLFLPALGVSLHLRRLGFRWAAERARPLVDGIERFTRANGRPPNELMDLVPHYATKLPTRIPEFELIVGDKAREYFGGNDWALLALVPTGVLNWDQFIYYPNQRYPEFGHGGGIERIGNWAYVHE